MSIDELKGRLETGLGVVTYEVEKGVVRRFAQAVGDPNPRWRTVAPPTLLMTVGFEQILQLLESFPSVTVIHGSSELECYRVVAPGDVLTAEIKVTSFRERQGKMGKMAFITIETAHQNQRQEPVARCRQMIIGY